MSIDIEGYYRKYGPMVLRRCRFLMRDEERAQDAMQDTFVKLLDKQDRLKDDYPSTLLYRIATNVCLNMIRTRKRRPETRDEEILMRIADADNLELKVITRDLISRIFNRYPPSSKAIAVMHYVDNMTLEQVASEVNLSVSGVRKRLRTIRENLDLEDIRDE